MTSATPTDASAPLAARAAHAETADRVLAALDSDAAAGLSGREARQRAKGYGPNLLRQRRPRETWRILVGQFKGPIVWLLLAAAGVSLAFGHWQEGIAIALVLLINGVIGFVTEIRAVRSMEALRRMATVATRVRRDGRIKEVPAQSLVPGDIVVLDGGDMVTADLRLIEAANLRCDESALTGESLPVIKDIAALPPNTPLADRVNMAFKGTAVTRGTGLAVVVATGMATELGTISALVETAEDEFSPLEKRLSRLSSQLIWLTLGMTLAIAGLGIAAGESVLLMIQAGVALAVAAIPEGLPIVATLTLARGMFRMAKRNALIERLTAVETLGATTVIFTDKTGTLTENRMTVSRLLLADQDLDLATEDIAGNAAALHALRAGLLCNNAQLGPDGGVDGAVGDPMEVALLAAARKGNLDRDELTADLPEQREVAFDSETKMMATLHRDGEALLVAVKGAPESVIAGAAFVRGTDEVRELDAAARADWLRRADALAEQGLRTLALAERTTRDSQAAVYEELTLLGLVGLLDPPRADVRGAIEACHHAGITVVMVTGDHAVTGHNIAQAVGLATAESAVVEGRDLKPPQAMSDAERARLRDARVFARVSPKQKLDLIAAYQADGAVVAMTGDGVNDAPALKKADIGIAMGQRGTQVAREAADMVLRDDAFPTIVEAIRQGRVIFGNLRMFVLYLLSCNLSEILVVGIAVLATLPLPLLPLQILFLNLVTDVFPAFALGAGEGDARILDRPPRDPKEPIVGRRHWLAIIGYGLLITAATLGALVTAQTWLGLEGDAAVTVSFLTLALAQLWHVFNMRPTGSGLLDNELVRNGYVWGALVLCVALLLGALFVPPVAAVLRVVPPDAAGWGVIVGLSLAPTVVVQAVKSLAGRKGA